MEKDDKKCMTCGTPREELKESPWGRYMDGILKIQCKPCREKEINDAIDSFEWNEGDTDYENVVICPYCGEKHEPDCESESFYNEGDYDFTCSNCESDFKLDTHIEITYSTSKQTQ